MKSWRATEAAPWLAAGFGLGALACVGPSEARRPEAGNGAAGNAAGVVAAGMDPAQSGALPAGASDLGAAGAATADPGAPDASGVEAGAPKSAEGEPPRLISGTLLTRYRGRFTGDESDHDLTESADLVLTDPKQRWQAQVLARAVLDIDGGNDPSFTSLMDSYEHRLQPQLFHAFVDFRSEGFSLLRLGRQPLYETPLTVLFDGARVELAPKGEHRLGVGTYAGIGEHLYESSSEGDAVLGAYASARAWQGAELRADWMHLEDARLGVDHEDDLLGLALSQDLAGTESFSRLEARFTSLEGDGRDLRLTASHVDQASRLSLQGSLYELLQTQQSLAAPLDPFSATLFELFPYYQLGLSVTKDWEQLALLSGADLRRLVHASDEGENNREFERYYMTTTLPRALPVSVSVTGELWHDGDTDIDTWGAALQRQLDPELEGSLGSYYALYKNDLQTSEERDHVRTYYIDLRWKPVPSRHWALRYEFERNDFDDFHQVRLDYSWTL